MIECVIPDLSPKKFPKTNLLPRSRSKPGRLAYVGKASRLTSLGDFPCRHGEPHAQSLRFGDRSNVGALGLSVLNEFECVISGPVPKISDLDFPKRIAPRASPK